MLKRVDVLCIGLACWDLNFHMEEIPDRGNKTRANQLISEGGGPAANAAYCIGAWGGKAAFGGRLSKDIFGKAHLQDLVDMGVNTSCTIFTDTSTSLSSVWVNSKGERSLVNYRRDLDTTDWDFSELNPTCLLLDGHEWEASQTALKEFSEQPSILDAGSWREETRELAKQVNYLVASSAYAKHAAGSENPDDWIKCLAQETPKVAITNGAAGVYWRDANRAQGNIPANPVVSVDTTGAGDIFHAAFALGLASDHSFYGCLSWANAVATQSVTRMGGRSSCPKATELPSVALLEAFPN